MDQDPLNLKNLLDRELADLQFHKEADVIARTHPATWRGRLRSFWNKELELPVIPLGTAFLLTFVSAFLFHAARQPETGPDMKNAGTQQRELIKAGGSMYWKDEIERRLSKHENSGES